MAMSSYPKFFGPNKAVKKMPSVPSHAAELLEQEGRKWLGHRLIWVWVKITPPENRRF